MKKSVILCVDDEKDILDSIRYFLISKLDTVVYTIEIAESALEALEIYEECQDSNVPVPLIISDYIMPGTKGDELLVALHKKDPKMLKILLTGQATLDGVKNAYENASLYRYIEKPWEKSDFLLTVQEALKSYTTTRMLEEILSEKEELLEEVTLTRLEVIRRLSRAAEYRDSDTGSHIIRMSKYCQLIAQAYTNDENEAELIYNAAHMHDLGKIGIPDNILLKPGKLTDDERRIIEKHCEIGADIISEHPSKLLKLARLAALSHHEKWDGTGYPYKLVGMEIPLIGRVAAIADVFDALTHKRPYKEAWETDRAVEYIKNSSGTHFEPKMVDAFLKVLSEILVIKECYTDSDLSEKCSEQLEVVRNN
jgi:putative two-component system response regulator